MPGSRLVSAMTSFIVVFVVLLVTAISATLNICPSILVAVLAMAVLWGLTAKDPIIGGIEAVGAIGGTLLIMLGIAAVVAFRVTFREW